MGGVQEKNGCNACSVTSIFLAQYSKNLFPAIVSTRMMTSDRIEGSKSCQNRILKITVNIQNPKLVNYVK